MRIRAFAKINLTLDVFSKRADGYHGIASVMQAISLHDTLDFTLRTEPGVALTCDGAESADIPTGGDNLVVRAANSAVSAAGVSGGIAIHLHKLIPSQAGLGGGSSDAAAALIGVNNVLSLNLSPTQLHELASSLGSDVPFFLHGGTASVRGRGERLTRLPDAPAMWSVIVKPAVSVSTRWAYNELDATPERSSNRGTKRMEEAIAAADRDLVVSRACNDFELPVFAKHPELAWLHDELMMAGATSARLCGSGSAMFGIAESEIEANRIARMVGAKYPKVCVIHTLTAVESRDYFCTNPLTGDER